METMTVRQSSGDDRIDALERKVDAGFLRVDERFKRVDGQFKHVDQRFDEVNQRFDRVEGEARLLRTEMKAGFDLIHERLDAFQRTMLLFYGTIIAALLGVLGTQL